jgi:hypothetical protein
MRYMSPDEYIDLSPPLKTEPFQSPSGKSLMQSFNRGDQIEAVPTLDVNVDGPTATVVDQDGRHRALLAKQEGVNAIPVAIRGMSGEPKEIVGMTGTPQALDYPKVPRQPRQEQQPQKEPISLFPSAQAAEPARDAAGNPVDAPNEWWKQGTVPVQGQAAAQPQAQPPADQWWREGTQPVPGQEQAAAQSQPGIVGSVVDKMGEYAGAATRAVAPYAAGAGAGAAMGAPFGGVGAIPGAIVGAGAAGLTQMATGLAGLKTPQDMTDALLDKVGVRRPESGDARIVEQATGGAANALSGAGAMAQVARALTNPLSKAVTNVLAENGGAQAAAGMLSGAASQAAAELGLGPAWQQLAGFAGGLGASAGHLTPNRWRVNASQAAKEAIEAGFSIPPAEAEEGHIGTMNLSNAAAAGAAKIKMGQLASAQNQPEVNLKVQQDLGVTPGTPLTPDVYRAVRNREGQVYRELAEAIPEVNLSADPLYKDAINKISDRLDKLMRAFPHTKTTPEVGEQMKNFRADLLRNATGETQTVMDYISELRRQANHNLTRDNNAVSARLGLAQREAASELEDALERGTQDVPGYYRQKLAQAHEKRDEIIRERVEQGLPLQGANAMTDADAEVQKWSDKLAYANADNQKNQSLVDRFRKARQVMAKSYDAEAVTNPSNGNVSATGLGRLLRNGRPLTGNLKLIADAANNFHRAFQDPTRIGGVEPLSVLDAAYAGAQMAAALASHGLSGFGHALAGLVPLTRPWVRKRSLSPERQNAMIAPWQQPWAPLSAGTTPLLPTQQTGNALINPMGDTQ